MTDGRGTMGDSEWQDQCRRWTGNRNGRFSWQGPEGPGRDEGGKGGGGSRGHRVVGGGRGTGLVPEGGRAEVGGLVTDTWVVSEGGGGYASAVSGDLRSGAPHTHYLSILSYLSTSYPRCQPPDFCSQLCTPKGVHKKVVILLIHLITTPKSSW